LGREAGFAEGRESGLAAGLAEGRRDFLMIVLQTKGTIPEELSDEIRKQSDLKVLDNWIALAGQVSDIEEFKRQIEDNESKPS